MRIRVCRDGTWMMVASQESVEVAVTGDREAIESYLDSLSDSERWRYALAHSIVAGRQQLRGLRRPDGSIV